MKKAIAIIAFLGILLQTFNQVLIVGTYYANKDYISKNLCENRSKPKMHCDGKCYLKKKLAKEGKEQAPSSKNQKSEEVVTLFYSLITFELSTIINNPLSPSYFSYNDLETSSFQASVFSSTTLVLIPFSAFFYNNAGFIGYNRPISGIIMVP